jgi:hypothetical protein
MTDKQFDELLGEMREESIPSDQVEAVKSRVRQRLTVPTTFCGDFRAQLKDYLAASLAESKRMLLEDHLARCAACRREFAELKGERKIVEIPPRARRSYRWAGWMAAAAAAVVAVYLGRDPIDSALAAPGPRATVERITGTLNRVSAGSLSAGATLGEGEAVRTGTGSRAILRLKDGSRVELNERTELSVRAAWSGQSIVLERGDVIVEAAKQRRGSLRVLTEDSVVSVKGTVFGVSAGSSGSLVSVIEGSVAVDTSGSGHLLKPGQQAASTPSLTGVPVKSAIAWSSDAEKYYSLLAELMEVEKQVAALPATAVRTQAALLPYLPVNAIAYVALPNFGDMLREAVRLIDQRAQDNETLREWWNSPTVTELKGVLSRVQGVAPQLGDEVVAVLVGQSPPYIPLVLAKVRPGQQTALQQALGAFEAGIPYRIHNDLLIASDSSEHVAMLVSRLSSGAASPFAAEIAQRYERGVGILAGVDLAIVRAKHDPATNAAFGVDQMKYAFFEQSSIQGSEGNSATLTFGGARTGIPSWLGSPGTAGSAEYIANDALFAVSALTRNPRQALEDLISMTGPGLAEDFAAVESKTGINVVNDLAGSLGTDLSIAIEKGAVLLVAELIQPSSFDNAVRRLVEALNSREADYRVTLAEENVRGRIWQAMRSNQGRSSLSWTYDRGYLVAATDRAVAEQALATRDGGFQLIRSEKFRDQLPSATGLHHSAFLWVNGASMLSGLENLVPNLAPNPALKTLLERRDPILVVVDGETERIRAASRTRLTSLLLDLLIVAGPHEGAGATL